jgi:16S rRNA (cytosine1402-N4)-methyltransferase
MRVIQPTLSAIALYSTTTNCFQCPTNGLIRTGRFHHPQRNSLIRKARIGITRHLSSESKEADSENFATSYHAPVMWKECIDALLECERSRIRAQGEGDGEPLIFVDGTLGGGGHSAALLERLQPGDVVFGCDVDPNALETASNRLKEYMNHGGDQRPLFIPIQSNFCDLASAIPEVLHPTTQQPVWKDGVDGILLDLGVSSHQIDVPERGFAFMKDGPLDMRMGGSEKAGLTAADICNEFDHRELQRIFSVYGDEPRAKTVAKAIVNHRPLSTTGGLVEAIASCTHEFAKQKRKGRTATCARIFQSLRIVVNNEDGVLGKVLTETCPTLIRPGGRLVVLSYHSMEDRATKRIMRDGTLVKVKNHGERDIYGNYSGPPKPFKPVGKRQKATEEEVETNPRARSASLRVAEREET